MATVMAFGVVAGVASSSAGAQVSKSYDASIDATLADIQNFWSQAMPDTYGQQYEAIPADRVFAYSESNPPPNCDDGGQTQAPYDEVAGNAFYCSNGDFVAYDEQGLLPKLREHFGEFAVGLVFAHELGHAVQARVGYDPSATVYLEQQADCFAGAWAQHVADSDDENVHLSTSDLDNALAGLLTLSDPSGIDGAQDGAHGNGFDRVSAFQDGYEGGAETCAAYAEHAARRHRVGLHELRRPGERRQPLARRAGADRHQEPRRVLGVAVVEAHRTHRFGRWRERPAARATVVCSPTPSPTTRRRTRCTTTPRRCRTCTTTSATSAAACSWRPAWASSVQHQLGRASAPTRPDAAPSASPVRGRRASSSSLSPGDLDEAVTVLVAAGKGNTDRGTAFDRVAAFRAGFKHGPSKCVQSS